ncbi:MAG: hypothetical protein U1C74_31285 [Phenylobacterium sp.]|jgi:hypothetical protein|uniref:Recombinase domain-containing protein n=1 Tax=Brevundimonas mediterranea TaxID=74329 RepID=A0AB37E5E7_9CAUL|nr:MULTISPECIES: hypothetical protein [Brevundimonas]MBA4331524.1 hypothetical protein [Brevundimonas sp.]MDZ4375889.1 hypothetical protein [Phenylobacterium sp.]QIH72120.1 hypothetical protein GYM46_03560 [Brevundimonas mediterranea]TAJ45063.1 MAG: hypothetical protein EPO54_06880 [Brevundimonas sp.]
MAKGSYLGGGKRAGSPKAKATPTGRSRERTPERPVGRSQSKPSQITRDELKHFAFRDRSKEAFLDELDPLLRACFKSGFTRPNEVAGLLNKAGKKTACGQPWTPHLVWGLQRFLFERREKKRASQTAPAAPSAPVSKPATSSQRAKDLAAEDMARLLGAIDRTSPSR